MNVRKFRWSKDYESAEEELQEFFKKKNISAVQMQGHPGTQLDNQTHSKINRIWCAEGSFYVAVDNSQISMQPGDALEIPPNIPYSITAGITGYVCYRSET